MCLIVSYCIVHVRYGWRPHWASRTIETLRADLSQADFFLAADDAETQEEKELHGRYGGRKQLGSLVSTHQREPLIAYLFCQFCELRSFESWSLTCSSARVPYRCAVPFFYNAPVPHVRMDSCGYNVRPRIGEQAMCHEARRMVPQYVLSSCA